MIDRNATAQMYNSGINRTTYGTPVQPTDQSLTSSSLPDDVQQLIQDLLAAFAPKSGAVNNIQNAIQDLGQGEPDPRIRGIIAQLQSLIGGGTPSAGAPNGQDSPFGGEQTPFGGQGRPFLGHGPVVLGSPIGRAIHQLEEAKEQDPGNVPLNNALNQAIGELQTMKDEGVGRHRFGLDNPTLGTTVQTPMVPIEA